MPNLKHVALAVGKSCGLFSLAASSRLRNSRVLVLGYHGVALEDEHLWNPVQFFTADAFRRRMQMLATSGCTVLGLEEALSRVAAHTLPERTVVLTFDDGSSDFYRVVWPILKEFGYPATLYLTTYYVEHRHPSPPGIWSYMLWKAQGSRANARELLGKDVIFDLTDGSGRAEALRQVRSLVASEQFDGSRRYVLTEKLAHTLGLDFTMICNSRVCQLLTPEEVSELARDGVSVQMHMHIHMSPPDREAYINNLEENRRWITKLTGLRPSHFCYPDGRGSEQTMGWLRSQGVVSATTSNPALLSARTERLFIPRLMDDSNMSDTQFESWLVGIAALVPLAFKKSA